jgi:hypothetical protein
VFNKSVLFLITMIMLMTMNQYYHVESHDNHHYHHENSLVDPHETAAEVSVVHYIEHIDSHKSIGILGSILLLFVLLRSIGFSFVSPLWDKVIQLRAKTTFYRYVFVDPPPTLLRSMLFHAPPQ